MIFDNIANRNYYKDDQNFERIFDVIEQLKDFPKQTITLETNNLFINPVCLTTKQESECVFEAHRTYIDFHYIVEGQEKIIVSNISKLKQKTEYDEISDVEFLEGENAVSCILNPGDFLVCYPHDAHKVAVANGENRDVKKLVGKIRV